MEDVKNNCILEINSVHWIDFISSISLANVFHHPAWSISLSESYNYKPFILAVKDIKGRVRAGLPLIEVKSWITGRRWVSLPFTDHCEPLYKDNNSLKCLESALIHMSQDRRIPKIELHRYFANPIAYKSGGGRVLHLLPLSFDIDNIANNFRKMHRRNILVAQKKGVRVEHGNSLEHLKAFYHLHLQSRRRQGIPVQPWKFFELLGKNLIEKGLGFVSLADKDNECIAAAVFLYWNKTLTYKYAAFNLKARRFCPNNLILWTLSVGASGRP